MKLLNYDAALAELRATDAASRVSAYGFDPADFLCEAWPYCHRPFEPAEFHPDDDYTEEEMALFKHAADAYHAAEEAAYSIARKYRVLEISADQHGTEFGDKWYSMRMDDGNYFIDDSGNRRDVYTIDGVMYVDSGDISVRFDRGLRETGNK